MIRRGRTPAQQQQPSEKRVGIVEQMARKPPSQPPQAVDPVQAIAADEMAKPSLEPTVSPGVLGMKLDPAVHHEELNNEPICVNGFIVTGSIDHTTGKETVRITEYDGQVECKKIGTVLMAQLTRGTGESEQTIQLLILPVKRPAVVEEANVDVTATPATEVTKPTDDAAEKEPST